MNPAHLHLMFNHIPVIGGMAALLLLLFGIATRSRDVLRVALIAFVLVGASTPVVVRTGEAAEDPVEAVVDDVGARFLREHEDAGEWVQRVMLVAAVVALAGLVAARGKPAIPRWAVGATLVLGLMGTAAAVRTANLGGKINHPEIRDGAILPADDGGSDSGRGRGRGRSG